jgi:hypothetical protein
MGTETLPPGVYPIAVDKYIISQVFEKFSNIKFHENPSIGSRVVLFGQIGQADGRTN